MSLLNVNSANNHVPYAPYITMTPAVVNKQNSQLWIEYEERVLKNTTKSDNTACKNAIKCLITYQSEHGEVEPAIYAISTLKLALGENYDKFMRLSVVNEKLQIECKCLYKGASISSCTETLSLTEADFSGYDLSCFNFDDLDLSGASFRNARLSKATFRNAKLDHAHFKNADLSLTDFEGVTSLRLSVSQVHQAINVVDVDGVKGLPSTPISIPTKYEEVTLDQRSFSPQQRPRSIPVSHYMAPSSIPVGSYKSKREKLISLSSVDSSDTPSTTGSDFDLHEDIYPANKRIWSLEYEVPKQRTHSQCIAGATHISSKKVFPETDEEKTAVKDDFQKRFIKYVLNQQEYEGNFQIASQCDLAFTTWRSLVSSSQSKLKAFLLLNTLAVRTIKYKNCFTRLGRVNKSGVATNDFDKHSPGSLCLSISYLHREYVRVPVDHIFIDFNKSEKFDFRSMLFEYLNLSDINFYDAKLDKAHFRDVNMTRANLLNVDVSTCTFERCELIDTKMKVGVGVAKYKSCFFSERPERKEMSEKRLELTAKSI
ncbi:MAG: pentapeptide repeat-containing protein [Shewanella sp.]|nr:pentapeptide repeat-containing protein [Shewanella sp.]